MALVEGFAGLVAADEPRAAVIGRDILGGGGNAADAAAAMFFTLAVTLPSRASLSSGGVCVIFDNGDKTGELLTFLPKTSGAGVVPIGVRAMAALHARQGIMAWGEVLRMAENQARFGHAVSRAFAQDLALAASVLPADHPLLRHFRTKAEELPVEGDRITQLELASVLGGVRAQGANHLHGSPFTKRLSEAMAVVGMAVEFDDLRDFVPEIGPAVAIEVGDDVAFFSGPPANGIVAAQLWQMLTEVEDYEGTEGADRAHLFAEAAMRSFADRAAWLGANGEIGQAPAQLVSETRSEQLMADYDAKRHKKAASLKSPPRALPENPAGTGFVVADRFGNAVACSLTMNRLFGSRRIPPGTGILLAAPNPGPGPGALSPSAVVVGNIVNGDARFAAAASGGPAAPTALIQVMLGALEEEKELQSVIRAMRLHHGGEPDELFHETGLGKDVISALRVRGHTLQEAAALGRVNAFHCPEGILDEPEICVVVTDPRGFGLAATAH